MDRREFLAGTIISAINLSFLKMPAYLKSASMGIVVHSYASRWNSKTESKKYPGFLNAIDLIEHCHKIGAGGVQVGVKDWTKDFAKKVRDVREKLGLYLEGSIALPGKSEDVSSFEKEVVSAKEAGAKVLRTVCLNGRRYETFQSYESFQEFRKNAVASLQRAEPIVRKHKMKLAVENHKDWRARELVSILKEIDSEWIGVTLDFGNNVALLEDPQEVVETLAPYAFSTHVKDMAVEEYADGFLLSEVPLGEGIVDLPKACSLCTQHNPLITFNLEMITRDPLEIPFLKNDYWSTFEDLPAKDLARTLRTVRNNKSLLPRVSHLGSEERLAIEEQNVLLSLAFSRNQLGLK